MSRKLMFCNTYYQLIFAIQMRLTVLKNDIVDLIVSDQSRNAELIAHRLEKECIFERIYFAKTKEMTEAKTTALKTIKVVFEGVFGSSVYSDISDKYDELLVHNFDISTFSLFSVLKKRNKRLICNRIEEGIISYRNIEARAKKNDLIEWWHRLIYRTDLKQSCEYFYCFFPQFYNGPYKAKNIPLIEPDSEIKTILMKIFDVSIDESDYKQKYLYFTSVYDFEGGKSIGEFELISILAEKIGKDNLLIKMHPRDTRGIYENNGYFVDRHSSIPWEVLQICKDFSDKVLLSTNSTSIVSTNLMTMKGAEAYYTYKLCDYKGNKAAEKTVSIIDQLINTSVMKKELQRVHIAESISEILC